MTMTTDKRISAARIDALADAIVDAARAARAYAVHASALEASLIDVARAFRSEAAMIRAEADANLTQPPKQS